MDDSFFIPTYVFITFFVWLFLRELRLWAYVIIDSTEPEDPPMSDAVRHMFS